MPPSSHKGRQLELNLGLSHSCSKVYSVLLLLLIVAVLLLPAAIRDLSSSSSCFYSHLITELFSRVYSVNSQ